MVVLWGWVFIMSEVPMEPCIKRRLADQECLAPCVGQGARGAGSPISILYKKISQLKPFW